MSKTKEKRIAVLPLIRVTPTEKAQIKNIFSTSNFPTQSAFIRARLLERETIMDQEKALKEELQVVELLANFEKIEAHVSQLARTRKRIKTNKQDKEELLLLAAILQISKKMKLLFTLKEAL